MGTIIGTALLFAPIGLVVTMLVVGAFNGRKLESMAGHTDGGARGGAADASRPRPDAMGASVWVRPGGGD